MKLKHIDAHSVHKKSDIKQLLKVMRITFFLIIAFTFQMMATSTKAQDAKMTLETTSTTVGQLLSEIEKQTDYLVVYSNKEVDTSRKINVKNKSDKVSSILDEVFAETDIDYDFENNYIVLAKRATNNAAAISNIMEAKNTQQQGRTITGTVVDNTGETIIGATIVLQGDISKGTVTDYDGNFTLSGVPDNAVFEVSYVGMKTILVDTQGKTSLDIIMEEDNEMLEELVVVGYGTMKKANLTGAVSQISSKDLENRPVSNATQILQGVMPNVNITFPSGEPGVGGKINIRGQASINGGDPLVLIDGVPGDINRINPSDIESISVLKDASASAIYGARGAFGVILVTTKNASSGKMNVSYSTYFATSTPTVRTDFMTTGYDAVLLNDTAFRRTTGDTYTRYSDEDMRELEARRYDRVEDPNRPWVVVKNVNGKDIYNYYGNYDWWNTVFSDNQPSQSHSLNVSGGNEKINYMLSGNYYAKDGIMKINTDKFKSYNFRSKVSAQLLNNLKLTNNTSYYNKDYSYSGREGGGNPNFLYITVHALPAYAPLNPDGTATYNTLKNNYSIGDGLLAMLLNGGSRGSKGIHEFTTTSSLELDVTKNLKLNADYTYQFYIADDWYRSTVSNYSIEPGILQEVPNYNTDQLKETMWFDPMYVANFYANYNNKFNKHGLILTGGINYENKKHSRLFASRKNLISESLNDLNLGTGDMLVGGGAYDYALLGAFFRANYDYDDRYLFELSGRYDGTSRFKKGIRYGFFPSFSTAWRISEEKFFENTKNYINNFKLRASYGTLGNQLSMGNASSSYYPYISTMNMNLSNYLINGEKSQNVSAPNPVIDNLTWEKATTINGGIDMSFINSKLNFTFDAYIRKTTDMLVPGKTLPAVFGAASPRQNAGDLETKGFEVILSWNDSFQLKGKPFNYGASFVLGDAVSKITKYDNPNNLLSNHYVGKKLGEIWGYKIDGFFKTDEEAANYRIDQTLVNSVIQASPGEWGKLRAGDIKFIDANNDGIISPGKGTADDPGDMSIIGNSTPRYNYGLNLNASWNNIDLSVFFQGIGKLNWYPNTNADKFWGPYSRPYYSFVPKDFNDKVWSEDNPNSYFPTLRAYEALNNGGALRDPNDKYMQNIGYLRLKNLVVGYSLPDKWMQRVKVQRCRLYISGENLLTWTPLATDYIDPEQPVADSNGRSYPLSKTISVGLDIVF